MNEEKILTLHPQGKNGKRISTTTYQVLKRSFLEILAKQKPTHTELFLLLNKELEGKFEGNINWYGETVKLDLEARKIIGRTDEKPPRYHLLAS